MHRLLKHLIAAVFVIVFAGCSGGGCSSGCAGCGMTPLPAGFDMTKRMENSASARLTKGGLEFIQSNIGTLAPSLLKTGGQAGVITFDIPKSGGSQCIGATIGGTCIGIPFNYTVCPNGSDPNSTPKTCVAEVDLVSSTFDITTGAPHDLFVDGVLKLRLGHLPVDSSVGTINISASNNADCNNPDFADVPLHKTAGTPGVDVELYADTDATHTGRYGYSKANIKTADFDQNAVIGAVHFCNGGFVSGILDLLKGLVGSSLIGGLTGSLTGQLGSALCMKSSATTPCPTGSSDGGNVGSTCNFPDNTCASTLLGMDGHMDLSSALASISPGTAGALDLQFAVGGLGARNDGSNGVWGDLNPVGGGATLGLYGGLEPSPQSGCVPLAKIALPTDIPMPDELMTDDATGWPSDMAGPHAKLALSERFTNYALGSAYNSGLLCLGLSTESVAQLNSGLFALLVPSINTLAFAKKPQQLAIAVRPQKPPTLTFGNGTDPLKDPTLHVVLPTVSMDFYVWSTDRFIRTFTATFDLDIPVVLSVQKDSAFLPQIGGIGVTNAKVTNSGLLKEAPDSIATALASVISGLAGQLTGGLLKPISLNGSLASLGLALAVPPSDPKTGSPGLRKITKGTDNYLGIYVSLALATGPIQNHELITSTTQATLTGKTVDPAGLRLATMTDKNRPVAHLRLASQLDDGSRKIEYSYRVDRGPWTPWTQERYVDVKDPILLVQAKHNIEVTSRVVGDPRSQSDTTVNVPVTIDVDAPMITIGRQEAGQVSLEVTDWVSHDDQIQVRYAFDGASFSPWTLAKDLTTIGVPAMAKTIAIEAKDEEGNLGKSQQSLIRGRPDPALKGSSSCGCSVPGKDSGTTGNAGILAIALGALAVVLRGRRSPEPSAPLPSAAAPRARRSRRPASGAFGAVAVLAIAGMYSGCSCGSTDSTAATGPAAPAGCDPVGDDPTTACTPMAPGLIGEYTSTAVDPSTGTIWVSGYNEADWNNGYPWGDLVVGKWDSASSAVQWVSVDGVPTDPPVDPTVYDATGFRGGQSDPGDDVGLWSSIGLDASGNPRVAYYDLTHKGLKFASFDGTAWTTSTIEQKAGSEFGRYAKLLMVDGKPVVAYMAVEQAASGYATSKVRIARASSATPAGPSDWAFEDAAVNKETPCREWLCPTGQKCEKASMTCKATSTSCKPDCASGSACFGGGGDAGAASCGDIVDKTKLDSYPEAAGDYVTIAANGNGGIGVVYYDRIHGNLMQARNEGGKWVTAILDGQTGTAPNLVDTGDVGIGASLFIDGNGDWHVSYVDGNKESVKYMLIQGGTKPQPPETVDDGLSLDGKKFDDGQHVVGDDSSIRVTPGGEVHIAYQDASTGLLRWAVGTAKSGTGHAWAVKAITQDGFAGAFSQQIDTGSSTQVANWWRKGGKTVVGDVRLVSP